MNIFQKLRTRFIRSQILKCQNEHREKRYINWKEIQSVHVLYGIDADNIAAAERIYRKLYAFLDENKNTLPFELRLTAYANNKMPVEAKRFAMRCFNRNSVNIITLHPNKEEVDKFLSNPTDLVMNISPSICYPLEYLAALSVAPFKMSLRHEESGANYDFFLNLTEPTNDPQVIFDAFRYYLEKIESR